MTDKGAAVRVDVIDVTSDQLGRVLDRIRDHDLARVNVLSFLDFPTYVRDKGFYTALRFLMLPAVLKSHTAVLALDIDGVMMRRPDFPGLAAQGAIGIEYTMPDPDDEHPTCPDAARYCAAGSLYVRGCKLGRRFAARLRTMNVELGHAWMMDQMLLWLTSQEPRYLPEVFGLRGAYVDWTFQDWTTVWTGMGPRKDHDERFVREREKWA